LTPIRVVVHGAAGKMGREITGGLSREPGLQVVGGVDAIADQPTITLPGGLGTVPFSADLGSVLTSTHPDVVVDFSLARATLPAARVALTRGVNMVIGTTGLSATDVEEIRQLADAHKTGAVVASNFALGAVLMMHLSRIVSKYMDYAEVIELHHHLKADAPSGTALSTARAMVQSRGKPFSRAAGQGPAGSRGQDVDGVAIHSVRLPGLMAHQEVIFGASGQTLSIRHDTINRECYLPGIIIAVKEVGKHHGLVYGLDTLLNL
jgi:4-hydroxy-tetrahydrodipicolinate reductase